ncbi:MAG: hypothetical protein CME36_06075 [unclassified Hahellaceae]|nr:hypothetical protein [Hahellaceae bacterium]|tara:strand:- start:74356 stop:75054 length:699 start_codon:yes stop_codon:yes gene_type:complete
MLYWLFLLITLPAVAGCGYLLILQYEQRERALRELDAEAAHRSERRRKLRPTDYYIKIALKDPLAVARRESMLGRFGSKVAPVLITKEVYKQLEQAISEQLDEREIEAEFSLHIARSPLPETPSRSARPVADKAAGKSSAIKSPVTKVTSPRPLEREASAGVIVEEDDLLLLDEPEVAHYPPARKRGFNPVRALRKKGLFGGKRSKKSSEDIDPYDDLQDDSDQTVRENLDR